MKRIALTLTLIGGLAAAAVVGAHAREHDWKGGHRAEMMQHMMKMSPEERTAFLDTKLAAIKTGLKLTSDQEKLWPAVETAARDNMKTMADLREKAKASGKPTDPVDGLSRMADMATARAEGLRKLADAAKPLYASLDDAQKASLPKLLHGMRENGRNGG